MWWRYQQLLLIQHYNTNHINCFILNWLIDDIIFKVCRYVWTSGLCVLPLSVLYLYHNNQAKSATSFSKCEAVYIFCVCMWLCKHPMDLRRGSLGWMMPRNQHWRSQLPVIVYTTTSSEESAKQCNWKMQLNFTAHWLCHHELFIKMCNAQRFVTTNQLYQHSCSLSNQPQYNSGACSGMLTSYNIHTTGMQSIESPTYYITRLRSRYRSISA